MNNYLLDTDIIIDVLRGLSKAISFVKDLEFINISTYTALELIDGCMDKKSLDIVSNLLEDVIVVEYINKSQNRALKFFHKYKLPKGIGLIDSLVAGIAYEQEYILITRNLRHYDFIEDLKVIAPY